MIKLKGLIKEFTEYSFDPMDMYSRNTKNAKAVERTLKKAGFSKVNLGKAQKQVRNIDQNMHRTRGVMFVHIQYHVIEGKDGKKYFIHQTQYHHRDFGTGGVNLTAVMVEERPNYPDDGPEKEIGRAVVLTSDFLDGLRNVNVLKRAS
tara:strand:- start:1722 stop:2165 length:444 start_codon:yes stop_codon:yes gene_type:complete